MNENGPLGLRVSTSLRITEDDFVGSSECQGSDDLLVQTLLVSELMDWFVLCGHLGTF